jgi:hypothetical protein
MEPGVIDSVCAQIYRKYPEVKGKKPKIKAYSGTQQLLIFNGQVETADGKTMPRTIRVIVDENGKIGKITTSR